MHRFLVRFAQVHDDFRIPELQSIAASLGLTIEVLKYSKDSPFCIVRLQDRDAAVRLISKSVLAIAISHLWADGINYDDLHASLHDETSHLWPAYHETPFRFDIDSYMARRPQTSKNAIIDSFVYMDLQGPIRPKDPTVTTFVVSEDHTGRAPVKEIPQPKHVFFSVYIASSARDVIATYDLKRRNYISTTSMDAELALVTANMALSRPGSIMYDPFCGTGSFLVAASHFGASVLGSDMDGRVVRGRIKDSKNAPSRPGKIKKRVADDVQHERSVRGNLGQYGLQHCWLDGFASDLTNSPIRTTCAGTARWLDAVVCDPPYGVREGLKVLGSNKPELQQEVFLSDGTPAHLSSNYIPPRRPYSFVAMLADILAFAADTVVDGGRLCIWIPAENTEQTVDGQEAQTEVGLPVHPCLRLVSVSTQEFTRWSRRLVVYERLPDSAVDRDELVRYEDLRKVDLDWGTADQLNVFRRRYFEGFKNADGRAEG